VLDKRTLQAVAVEVGVRELRENLSEWLDRAAAGQDVIVTERGTPKARLTAATGEHILDRLAREGRLRRATRPRGPLPPPVPVEGNPVTNALLAHRRAKGY
jgi:prevent-host-death family protein